MRLGASRRRVTRGRGITLPEVMIASALLFMSLLGLVNTMRACRLMWAKDGVEVDVQQQLARAVARMEPTLREALEIDRAASSGGVLAVVLPARDPATGGYVLPLRAGDRISFYLSDTSGTPGRPGSILWRSVNGAPDAGWSLMGSRGRIDLGAGTLRFNYPSVAYDTVQVSLSVTRQQDELKVIDSVSTELFARNSAYW